MTVELDTARCRRFRRHRWVRTEDATGRTVKCSRCKYEWFEPRLFAVAMPA